MLGRGWYSQELAHSDVEPTYGPPRLIFNMKIDFVDGKTTTILSDANWTGRAGSILRDSLYHGEMVDGRLICPDWAKPNLKDPDHIWKPVDVLPAPVCTSFLFRNESTDENCREEC